MTSNPNTEKVIPNVLEFSNLEPQGLLKSLDDEGVTEVAIIGGSQINSSFLQENLVDEIYLTIAPMLFGRGLSFAAEYDLDMKLQLIDEEKLSDNVVLLHYEVVK
jgi:dihydrofolate reductase